MGRYARNDTVEGEDLSAEGYDFLSDLCPLCLKSLKTEITEPCIRRLADCRAEVSATRVFSLFLATDITEKKKSSRRNNDARTRGMVPPALSF